ncbi:MAG: trypsin-like serine protease [Candidatus Promineifilaceae bacterium]
MVRRLIVISLVVFIFFSNPTFVSAAESAEAPAYIVEDSIQQQILGATLRITMIARDQSSDEPAYAVSNGLGTLVQDGDAAYIVTHDHWSRLARKVAAVRFESAAGELLLEVTPSHFYSLIRYRDGGTMVLVAPNELPDCVRPLDVADKDDPLAEGDELAIAYWQPDDKQQVSVEPVTIQVVEEHDGNASIKMQSLNGRVVEHGNSGGGVFAGTQLVGNMWETITFRNQDSGQQTSGNLSRAARYTYDDAEHEELMADFSATPGRGGAF